jgi:non-ribosomal peptide synthetase component E (peptide arylation enzyme)
MSIGVREPMPGVVYPSREDLERYVAAGALGFDTLAGAYLASFERHAGQLALTGPEGEVSYRDLDERTDRLAAALLGLGIKPLDRALFQIANSAELVIATIACLKAGVIPICTLATHRELEIGELGRHAEARLWFVQGDDEKFDLLGQPQRSAGTHRCSARRWQAQARGFADFAARAAVDTRAITHAHRRVA